MVLDVMPRLLQLNDIMVKRFTPCMWKRTIHNTYKKDNGIGLNEAPKGAKGPDGKGTYPRVWEPTITKPVDKDTDKLEVLIHG